MGRLALSGQTSGHIRKARASDLAVIQSVLNAAENLGKLAAYPDATLKTAITSRDQSLMVLDQPGDGVCAFLWMTGLHSHPSGAKIEEFGAVRPGLGWGGALFDAMTTGFTTENPDRSLWLAVAADNTHAIRFYEHRGFRRTEIRPGVWHRRAGPVADALIMQRDPPLAQRLTPNETQVLDLLRAANSPQTAYQLLGRMRGTAGAVAPPTVYRALKRLEEAGLVTRIETLRAWTLATDNSPGVVAICDDCGSVSSVPAPEVFQNLHESLAARGFAEARQTIEVHGRCGDCAGDKA